MHPKTQESVTQAAIDRDKKRKVLSEEVAECANNNRVMSQTIKCAFSPIVEISLGRSGAVSHTTARKYNLFVTVNSARHLLISRLIISILFN